MNISTNEPLLTHKLCPNLAISAIPFTDKGGMYQGEAQSIWLGTDSPLSEEQQYHLEKLGLTLSKREPAYSQGSMLVHTAELHSGANLKALLALRHVLHLRGSVRLEPLSLSVPGLPSNQQE